jgi:hypothetical protein
MTSHPAWRSPLDTIRLNLAAASAPEPIRHGSFAVLDALQRYRPETQLDALFATAVAMSQSLGLDPHDMVVRARRVLPDLEAAYTNHLQAIRDYAKGELTR